MSNPATHAIQITPQAVNVEPGESLSLSLPSGEVLNLLVTAKKTMANNGVQLNASFEGVVDAVITFGEQVVFANISSESLSYGISIDEFGQAFLVDHSQLDHMIDLGDDMFEKPSNLTTKQLAASKEALAMATSSNVSKTTILVLYSAEFANGFADPISRINQMIGFTNAAYARSGIHVELELAHAQQLNFNNSTNIGTLLDQVTDATSSFSGVPVIRDRYYADLVAVLPYTGNGGVGGVAWVNGDDADFAYSVTQFASWGSDSVFAHEVGHNMGSGHERRTANPRQSSPCSGGLTGYACGHGNGSNGTIMSYLDDRAWGYVFSNPDLTCGSEPCGIRQGQAEAADNRTSFNISGPLVQAFRIDDGSDLDRDGVDNDRDNCPNTSNPNQADRDGDGIGDVCDDDFDNDGVNNATDNCLFTENADQLDEDEDGIGDACDDESFCFPLIPQNRRVVQVCL